MAQTPYIPDLKYSGNQIILSSGKITLHSKDDSIMLFGKKAIALSSLGTVNLDIAEKLLINAPKIQLGLNAEKEGEPIVLGNKTIVLLARLLDSITAVGASLAQLNESNLSAAVPDIVKAGSAIRDLCPSLRADLEGLLSKVTYTK